MVRDFMTKHIFLWKYNTECKLHVIRFNTSSDTKFTRGMDKCIQVIWQNKTIINATTNQERERVNALIPVTLWLGWLFYGKATRLGNEVLDSIKYQWVHIVWYGSGSLVYTNTKGKLPTTTIKIPQSLSEFQTLETLENIWEQWICRRVENSANRKTIGQSICQFVTWLANSFLRWLAQSTAPATSVDGYTLARVITTLAIYDTPLMRITST